MNAEIIKDRLNRYIGFTYDEIHNLVDNKTSEGNKSKEAYVVQQLFNQLFNNEILKKEGKNRFCFANDLNITLKSSRVGVNDTVQESSSFPTIGLDIINQEWDTSSVKNQLIETEFIWCFWKLQNNKQILTKVANYKIKEENYSDIKQVWLNTKSQFVDKTYNFPKITENTVAHVRNNDAGKYELVDQLGGPVKKQCFWLNDKFINENIYKS